MKSEVYVSGIQPTGELHLGNYLGALRQWVRIQNDGESRTFVCMLVDLHAVTVHIQPHQLQKATRELAAWMLASGLDPKKVHMFQQSHNPDHAELMWLLNCITPMGWLERMTQFKEKSAKQGERASAGLFMYPVLMAADILLYGPKKVPVGEDQIQHIELARDLAKRFNTLYGETFVEPQAEITRDVARIMSLQDPTKKMSKSDENQNGVIRLSDSPDTIRSKVRKAVTDSGTDIRVSPDKPALTQLIHMYAHITGRSVSDVENAFEGKQYGDFKSALAEVIVSELEPIQKKFHELMSDPHYIDTVLQEGCEQARMISTPKLQEVKKAMGFSF